MLQNIEHGGVFPLDSVKRFLRVTIESGDFFLAFDDPQ